VPAESILCTRNGSSCYEPIGQSNDTGKLSLELYIKMQETRSKQLELRNTTIFPRGQSVKSKYVHGTEITFQLKTSQYSMQKLRKNYTI
jgi:hypothetical protein